MTDPALQEWARHAIDVPELPASACPAARVDTFAGRGEAACYLASVIAIYGGLVLAAVGARRGDDGTGLAVLGLLVICPALLFCGHLALRGQQPVEPGDYTVEYSVMFRRLGLALGTAVPEALDLLRAPAADSGP